MKRYQVLELLGKKITQDTIVVCNLQDTTYEWCHLRPSDANLLRIGLALVTPVAMGISIALPHRKVIALDGDGSIILGLGALTTLGRYPPTNLLVIVLDNETYNSGGAIPSATAENTDLAGMARFAGIKNSVTVKNLDEVDKTLNEALKSNELWLIVAKTERQPQVVPRPTIDGQENKYRFVRFIERLENKKILPTEEQKSFT
jgi:thiamine pyrophosphate-dependent acetolactate synthase large subunit-like protein